MAPLTPALLLDTPDTRLTLPPVDVIELPE